MISYFDSSALVKRYMTESGSSWVQQWCADPTHTVAIAEIGLVEVAAAFAGKLRGKFITPSKYQDARADLAWDARYRYVLVVLERATVDEAIDLTSRYHLRGYDAVHLASALAFNRTLVVKQAPSLLFVASDQALLTAATAEGLATENPQNHP